MLEVLHFLDLPDAETRFALVCKSWFHHTRDNDHWKRRYIEEFQPPETDSAPEYRRKFIAKYLSSCWVCKQIPSLSNIARKCPIYRRPICIRCSSKPEFSIVSLQDFAAAYDIDISTLKLMRVGTFPDQRKESTYRKLLIEAIIEYAEKRRRMLVTVLCTEFRKRIIWYEIPEIEMSDLQAFYRGKSCAFSKLMRKTVIFCGKNEPEGEFARSVEEFLKEIEENRGRRD